MARIIEEAEEGSTKLNKIMDRGKRKSLNDSERAVTDRSWRIVFFIVFIPWIIFVVFSTFVQTQPGAININAENHTKSHNSSELLAPFYLWGRHWAFDAITCNPAYLQTHYNESGVIVIATNLLFSIGLLIYSIGPTRRDILFHYQLDKAAACFALIFTFYRLLIMTTKKVDWPIPEVTFFILWYTKRHYMVEEKNPYHPIVRNEQLPLYQFKTFPFLSVILACKLACLTVFSTWSVLHGYDLPIALYYLIIAASFYVALTVHYLGLMIFVCMIDLRMDLIARYCYHLPELTWTEVESFQSVWRYHLGTACYHATIILPRLKTLAVMNEAEFKDMLSDMKLVDRLALTQGKLHDLTIMATAVAGTDHAESMRELLRHWHTAGPRDFVCLGGYAQIIRSSLAFLLSTSNLMTLFLWSHGAHYDPHTVMQMWKYYLLSILTCGVAMRNYHVVMDTINLFLGGLVPNALDSHSD